MKGLAYRGLGLLLIAFCAATWAWMLGAFALEGAGYSQLMKEWSSPGVGGFPAIAGSIAGVVGMLFVLGAWPPRDGTKHD
ncbi:hypothetical protein [Burkholderia cenocepacia]|uniref:hypothetical protein n=1 Tax=Burkholderia cenocepacia TaxID=95486 RepID=UPI002ABE06C8|nr:hypothetical protein [Burkholderia cenocepacia]